MPERSQCKAQECAFMNVYPMCEGCHWYAHWCEVDNSEMEFYDQYLEEIRRAVNTTEHKEAIRRLPPRFEF